MSSNNVSVLKSLPGFIFVLLLVAFSLASCESRGKTTGSIPTLTLSATSTLIAYKESTDITWSATNSTNCASSGGGGTGPTGTFNTGSLTTTTVYYVTCGSAAKSITITVAPSAINRLSSSAGVNPGCVATGSTGAITLSNVPSRSNGVAPLSVFFDASATTDASVTTRPFHDLEYRWDFGDANAGTWKNGAQPGVNRQNSATGPVAAHVFKTPGVYNVKLSATDGKNTAENSCTQIVVQDPDTVFSGANTICVAASSTPVQGVAGCPAGARTAQQANFVTAISSYALTGKRVLFKRGDKFAAASTASITRTGPGIVGAFGTGAAPVVQMTGNAQILALSSPRTPTIKDWRIMDLEFDGMSKSASIGIDAPGGIDQVLILNMNIHDIYHGIRFSDSYLQYNNDHGFPGHAIWDQIAIVDSAITPITNSTSGWRILVSAKHLSIIGNALGEMKSSAGAGSHVIRTPYIGKGVIADNTIARAKANLAIKMHGPVWCDVNSAAGQCIATDNTAPPASYRYLTNKHPIGIFAATSGYTEKVIVSDNKLLGASSPYLVVAGPQNPNRDERVRDVIFERNWFKAGNNATRVALVIHSYETTVRNNICDMTGGDTGVMCFNSTLYGRSPARAPHDIRIYNNTGYKSGAGSAFVLAKIDTTSTNVTVRNNLAYAPLSSSALMFSGTGASGFIESDNSSNTQIKSTFPGWVSRTPSNPADFSLAHHKSCPGYMRRGCSGVLGILSHKQQQNGVIDMSGRQKTVKHTDK